MFATPWYFYDCHIKINPFLKLYLYLYTAKQSDVKFWVNGIKFGAVSYFFKLYSNDILKGKNNNKILHILNNSKIEIEIKLQFQKG